MVLAAGNGRVISLAESLGVRSAWLSSIALSPWFAVVQDLRLWCRAQWVSVAFLVLFCVAFELLRRLEQ